MDSAEDQADERQTEEGQVPAGAALGEPAFQRLDPRSVPCDRVALSVLTAVMGAAAVGVFAWLALGTGLDGFGLATSASLLGLGVGALALAAWRYPPLKFRHTRWRLSAGGLEIREGVWFRHARHVPRERIQHTDVERGPFERRFGLATLVVFTAGHQNSENRLDGLEHETALALRARLLGARARDGA